MKKVEITCKGSCDGNPGAGAWGSVLVYEDQPKKPVELAAGYLSTTNYRMEMMAVIAALTYLEHENYDGILYTNLELISREHADRWTEGKWPQNGWRGSNREKIDNIDLWKWIARLRKRHNLKVEFVPERLSDSKGDFHRTDLLIQNAHKINVDYYHQNPEAFEQEFSSPRFPAIYDTVNYHQGEIRDARNWQTRGFCFAWSPTTGDIFVHRSRVSLSDHVHIQQGAKIQFKAQMSDRERPEAIDVTLLSGESVQQGGSNE